jgi:hypothetical protein
MPPKTRPIRTYNLEIQLANQRPWGHRRQTYRDGQNRAFHQMGSTIDLQVRTAVDLRQFANRVVPFDDPAHDELLRALETNEDFQAIMQDPSADLHALVVGGVNVLPRGGAFDPLTAPIADLRAPESIEYRYIVHELPPKRPGHTHESPVADSTATSCFIDLIVNTYAEAVKKAGYYKRCRYCRPDQLCLHDRFCHYYREELRELTPEFLRNLCGLDQHSLSLSITQSLRFFETYNIGFQPYNAYGHRLPGYEPHGRVRVSPPTLHVVFQNNHCYLANAELKRLALRMKDSEREESFTLYPPPAYYRLKDAACEPAAAVVSTTDELDALLASRKDEGQM